MVLVRGVGPDQSEARDDTRLCPVSGASPLAANHAATPRLETREIRKNASEPGPCHQG